MIAWPQRCGGSSTIVQLAYGCDSFARKEGSGGVLVDAQRSTHIKTMIMLFLFFVDFSLPLESWCLEYIISGGAHCEEV